MPPNLDPHCTGTVLSSEVEDLTSTPTTPPTTMAKSLRSKTKLANRRRKANESHYAVVDAERTARISARIVAKAQPATEDAEGDAAMAAEGDEEMKEGECNEGWVGDGWRRGGVELMRACWS